MVHIGTMSYWVDQKHIDSLASALRKACDEHGRPNSYMPSELHSHHGGPSPLLIGKIGRYCIVELWRALGGREGFGSCPVYRDRRFFV